MTVATSARARGAAGNAPDRSAADVEAWASGLPPSGGLEAPGLVTERREAPDEEGPNVQR